MKTVIIDNYDSFTYNLAHLVKELGAEVDVLRNDKFELEELEKYDKIILSPGPGIPEELREKVFERFFRVDKSRSKETGGTGLGLAIVKHAVMYHGGSIEVKSTLGEATTFILRFPAMDERAN